MIFLINNHKLSGVKRSKAKMDEGQPRWQAQVKYQGGWRNCTHPLGCIGEKRQNEKVRVVVDRYPATILHARGNLPKIGHEINSSELDNNQLFFGNLGNNQKPQAHTSFGRMSIKTGNQCGRETVVPDAVHQKTPYLISSDLLPERNLRHKPCSSRLVQNYLNQPKCSVLFPKWVASTFF